LEAGRREGFRSTNIDLIYGLPLQTVDSFSRTLDTLIAAGPERFSIFNYAHMPARFKVQRQINDADLPSADVKLALLQMVGAQLTSAGYVYIGMDHFAKPDDELAVAQREGNLHRNFQATPHILIVIWSVLGITAIGRVGSAYSQNAKELDAYDAQLKQGRLPVLKGFELNNDDKLRRDVISQLICHFELSFADMEKRHAIQFADYFARELNALRVLAEDGLIALTPTALQVTPPGRMLIRNICMVFDNYLAQKQQQQFSRVI